jgi:hypothetical protein
MRKLTVILAFALVIGPSTLGTAAPKGTGDSGGVKGVTRATSPSRRAVPYAKKIKTPDQCYRHCRLTLGADYSFCTKSCY